MPPRRTHGAGFPGRNERRSAWRSQRLLGGRGRPPAVPSQRPCPAGPSGRDLRRRSPDRVPSEDPGTGSHWGSRRSVPCKCHGRRVFGLRCTWPVPRWRSRPRRASSVLRRSRPPDRWPVGTPSPAPPGPRHEAPHSTSYSWGSQAAQWPGRYKGSATRIPPRSSDPQFPGHDVQSPPPAAGYEGAYHRLLSVCQK